LAKYRFSRPELIKALSRQHSSISGEFVILGQGHDLVIRPRVNFKNAIRHDDYLHNIQASREIASGSF
jgi:hypothetical protein